MGSSRLPGKVLKKIDNDYSVLYYVVKQLQSSELIERIVVATTTLDEDDEIVEYCKKCTISNQRPSSAVEFKQKKTDKKEYIGFKDGVCDACRFLERKTNINYDKFFIRTS